MRRNNNWGTQIGQLIRSARKQHGLTGADLGDRIGVNPSAVSKIESGKRKVTIDELDRISEILGIDLGDVFGKLQRGEQIAPKPPETVEIRGHVYQLVGEK